MSKIPRRSIGKTSGRPVHLLLAVAGCGGLIAWETAWGQVTGSPASEGIAQPYTSFVQPGGSPADEYFSQPFATYPEAGQSLAGEGAAEALKQQIENEPYEQHYGPLRVKTTAGLGVNYTDNVFYSSRASSDLMIEPEGILEALWPLSEFNTLDLSLGVSYQYFLEHGGLNPNAPLVDPGTELALNIFAGNFRIQLHEMFSYQESLFFNSFANSGSFFNLTNVGTFSRLDNVPGIDVLWDMNKAILTVGFDHEDFVATTSQFKYLNRSSEWLNGSLGFLLGDHAQAGVEGLASLHNYYQQTVMNNNWRGRAGPFVDLAPIQKIFLRFGGGYDTARYPSSALNANYSSYYLYGRISQQTRLFTHSLEAGRQLQLGNNADNMKTVYMRYAITTPIIHYFTLGADIGVDLAQESGGPTGFSEKFTLYDGGFSVGWQFRKHWRTDLGYELTLNDSNLPGVTYHRNQVSLDLVWTF